MLLIDLKTTASPIGRFDETFEKYNYYRQLAFYSFCLEQAYPEYTLIGSYIVAVQTNKEFPCDVFKVDRSWIKKGTSEMHLLLDRVAYHMSCNNWGNSMETQLGMIQQLILPDEDR